MSSFMEFSGERELVNTEKAKELLKFAEAVNPTHIKLSNKSFDNGAAEVIAEYLASLTSVHTADISDIIAGRPEEEALQTLKIICSSLKSFSLTEVNVSDNAFGGKGVDACRDILTLKTIEKLYMCNNGLSAEACSLVCQILLEGGCPPLRVLHFYNNMSGSAGATAVSEIVSACPFLEDFRFSATRSGPEGCLSIAKSFGGLSSLRRIDLSDNNVGDEASEVLAENIVKQSELQYLNLRDDALGVKGLKSIVSALGGGVFVSLQHLDLSGNEVDEGVAGQLASTFKSLPALTCLNLDDNELTSKGAKFIAKSLHNLQHLRTLTCNSCELTSSGALALSRSVAKISSFEKLEMNGNDISESALTDIYSVLSRSHKKLGDMDDNNDDADDEDEDEEEEDEEENEEDESLKEGEGENVVDSDIDDIDVNSLAKSLGNVGI